LTFIDLRHNPVKVFPQYAVDLSSPFHPLNCTAACAILVHAKIAPGLSQDFPAVTADPINSHVPYWYDNAWYHGCWPMRRREVKNVFSGILAWLEFDIIKETDRQ